MTIAFMRYGAIRVAEHEHDEALIYERTVIDLFGRLYTDLRIAPPRIVTMARSASHAIMVSYAHSLSQTEDLLSTIQSIRSIIIRGAFPNFLIDDDGSARALRAGTSTHWGGSNNTTTATSYSAARIHWVRI